MFLFVKEQQNEMRNQKMQTMKNVNYMISNRIALMVCSTMLVLAHLAHAQLILVYDANDANMTEYCAIADSIRKENVKVLTSCDKYLGDAQAVFKDADPNGTIKKIGECNYSEVRAKVQRMALVTSPFSNTAYPAAGLPGVKTYISVRGSKEQPLKLAQNLDLWQGVVYLDGDGNVMLSEGTSYKLDGLEFKAKGAQTTESVEGKPISSGIVKETETAKTLFEKGKAVLPDGKSIDSPLDENSIATDINKTTDSGNIISEIDLDNAVQWISQIKDTFPEDMFGLDEEGNLTQKSDKPVLFQIVKIGRNKKTNKTILLTLSIMLKSKGKNKFGEFLFSMDEYTKVTNLASADFPSKSIILYRNSGSRITDWQRKTISAILRISGTALSTEDIDFLNRIE
jgi:hypothetical protein